MKWLNRALLATLCVLSMIFPVFSGAQTKTDTENQATKTESQATVSPDMSAEEKNIQAYINLMRENVRQEKAQIMGGWKFRFTAESRIFRIKPF